MASIVDKEREIEVVEGAFAKHRRVFAEGVDENEFWVQQEPTIESNEADGILKKLQNVIFIHMILNDFCLIIRLSRILLPSPLSSSVYFSSHSSLPRLANQLTYSSFSHAPFLIPVSSLN